MRAYHDSAARHNNAVALTAAILPPVRSNGGGLRHHPGGAKRAPTGRPRHPADRTVELIASGTVVIERLAVRRAVKAIAAGTCWAKPHGKTGGVS